MATLEMSRFVLTGCKLLQTVFLEPCVLPFYLVDHMTITFFSIVFII